MRQSGRADPLGPAGYSPDIDDDSIDIGEVAAQLWSGRVTLALCVVLGLGIGLFKFVTTARVYQANALIQLESKGSQLGLPESMLGLADTGGDTTTEIEIIGSRLVLGQAIAALNLDWQASPVLMPVIGVAVRNFDLPVPQIPAFEGYARSGDDLSLDLLQVVPDWIDEPIMLTMTGDRSYEVVLPDGTMLSGIIGQMLSNPEKTFGLRLSEGTAAVGRRFLIKQRNEASVIEQLRGALVIEERGRGSGILQLTYKAPSPLEAQRVLDAITDAYIKQNIARGVANADSGLEFLNSQLPMAEAAVREAEAALNAYSREAQVVDLSFESQSMLTQVDRINADLQQLQAQEDELQQRYTKNHPLYQQLLNNRARLEAQLEVLRIEADGLPETQRNMLNLTGELELAQEAYMELQSRAREVQVVRASNVGSVRIIDLAQAAERPVAPRAGTILLIAAFLGGLLGVGVVLFKAWRHKGVQGAEQIEAIGMSVMATVNYVRQSDSRIRGKTQQTLDILALTDPGNLAVEAFRSIRTSLHFGMLDAKANTVLLTSAAPGAGKSFTSTNLAVVLAQAGKKVCLIDADLRRGQLRKYFNKPKNTPGLTEYLIGEKTIDEVIYQTPVDGLSFMSCGRYPPNPADVLERTLMKELVSQLNTRFDMVILDAPPVLAVSDPVILGRLADAVLFVVHFDETPLGEIDASQRILTSAGLKVTGAILNGFDPSKATGSSYSYRYEYKTEE